MIHAHNPIMQRLEEMAKLWQQKVQPQHRLLRWMLKPEESRMYEGFCRWEASQHGFLDNLFLFFYTSFTSAKNYSHAIMQNWLQEWNANTEQRKLLTAAGAKGEWDISIYQQAVDKNDYEACNALLPQMLDSYRSWLNVVDKEIVLAILPKEMASAAGFNAWLQTWMQQALPLKTQVLLFDHEQDNFWGNTFMQYNGNCTTLHHDLRMQQAIQQIATQGAATDPHAFFRKCMFEMGNAASQKNVALLDEWGAKAIEAAKKSGDKNLLATAYITYAGMLFTFKQHIKITSLLDEGMALCKQRVVGGDEAMKSLLLQYYAYKGSHHQIKKEYSTALEWFMKTGEEATAFGFYSQAVSAYYKAYVFADYKGRSTEKKAALLAAVHLTDRLTEEEIQSSEYPFVAYEFVQSNQRDEAGLNEKVIVKMQLAFGDDWMETVIEMKKNYTKKKLKEAKHSVLVEEE